MGMAKHPDLPPDPIPKESALLTCETCGAHQRVWLNRCQKCCDPEVNWYEARIAKLEEVIQQQDKLIRNQADTLNSYAAELRLLKPAYKESENAKAPSP